MLTGEKSSPAPRTVSLQWDHGFDMNINMHGRITLNKITGLGTYKSWHFERYGAISGYVPPGCYDIFRKRPPMYIWCVTWVDDRGEQQGMWRPTIHSASVPGDKLLDREVSDDDGGDRVRERWEFIRWNQPKYYGATREREEESVRQPGAIQLWEETMRKWSPPARSWVQERWDLERPHSVSALEGEAVNMDDLHLEGCEDDEGDDMEGDEENDEENEDEIEDEIMSKTEEYGRSQTRR